MGNLKLMYNDYNGFNKNCISTQLKFTFLPQKCFITGRKLWFEYAYKQTAMWTGPGSPVIEDRWYDKKEFLINSLKNV